MAYDQIRKQFEEFEKFVEEESDAVWSKLSKEEQMYAFCAVVRRLHKGELEDRGTYRYILYDVFGFGPEAYVPAQISGFLALHNAIVDADYDSRLLHAFCKRNNIDHADEKISNFLI